MSTSCPSVFLTNARSILPKLDELRLCVSSLKADIVFVTESWLTDDVADDLLSLNSMDIFRCDRILRRGGGVCVWINSSFLPRVQLTSPSPSSIEFITVRISCAAFSIICCGIYIPPGLHKVEHDAIGDYLAVEFDRLLSRYPDDKLLIAGDFNDFNTDFFADNFNLINRVDACTRNDAILDHIWINDDLCDYYPHFANVGPPLGSSDHNCVFLKPVGVSASVVNSRSALLWDFRDSNMNEFILRLTTTNFDVIKQESSVDAMCSKFYELLWQCLTAIPCEVVQFSPQDKQWMTPILKSLINKRWRAFREKNWVLYKHYKAKVKEEILKAKRMWCDRQSKTARGLWGVVRSLRGSHVKDPWRHLIQETGGLQELLSQLTSQFCNNFNEDDVELAPLLEQEWNFHITVDTVYNHLLKLHCGKATGPDLVPPHLLKTGAQFLCYPLADIFNASILHKTFPVCFKHAHVCPIPKTRDPSICDFRPISLLSPLSKVFEKIVLEHIRSDLFACYGPEQHAYRPFGSTTSALIDICDHVTTVLDRKDVSHVNMFCLDLSKAFDKLSHHRLINYLSSNGMNHGFLRWLCSYLFSRSMCVKIHDSFGPRVTIPSGVPQGSVLGPFLFAAFMGSIDFCHLNVKCIKYADDITLIEPLTSNMTSSVSIDECISIFDQVGLSVNQNKCNQLHICRRPQCNAMLANCGFSKTDSVKILGVVFNNRFSFDMHVSNVLKTASRRLHIIRCMKSCVPPKDLVTIYHALITSILCYASPAFGLLPATLLTRLERFQRRAHRLICGQSACQCSGFPSLNDRFADSATDLLLRAEANCSHPLHRRIPARLPSTNQFRNPVCLTNRRLNSFFPWACRLHNSNFHK